MLLLLFMGEAIVVVGCPDVAGHMIRQCSIIAIMKSNFEAEAKLYM